MDSSHFVVNRGCENVRISYSFSSSGQPRLHCHWTQITMARPPAGRSLLKPHLHLASWIRDLLTPPTMPKRWISSVRATSALRSAMEHATVKGWGASCEETENSASVFRCCPTRRVVWCFDTMAPTRLETKLWRSFSLWPQIQLFLEFFDTRSVPPLGTERGLG